MQSKSSHKQLNNSIVVYYFGKALSAPFEVKATDDELKTYGIKSP